MVIQIRRFGVSKAIFTSSPTKTSGHFKTVQFKPILTSFSIIIQRFGFSWFFDALPLDLLPALARTYERALYLGIIKLFGRAFSDSICNNTIPVYFPRY